MKAIYDQFLTEPLDGFEPSPYSDSTEPDADVNMLLETLLIAARATVQDVTAGERVRPSLGLALAELVLALDAHLRQGLNVPERWMEGGAS